MKGDKMKKDSIIPAYLLIVSVVLMLLTASIGSLTTTAKAAQYDAIGNPVFYAHTTIYAAQLNKLHGGPAFTSYSTNNAATMATKAPIASPTFTGTPLSTTPATTDNTTKIATTAFGKLAFQSGYATFTALTPGSTVTWTPVVGTNVYTLTPGQTETINMGTVPAGCVGQLVELVITTSGVSSYTLTFGTNIRYATSTLATGTTTAKKFTILYLIESTTSVIEISRTVAE